MSKVGCHRVDMDAVDECLSLSVNTMDTCGRGGRGARGINPPICITGADLVSHV